MTVTRAEFARLMQVDRSTVTRWVEAGRVQLDAHGRIDAAAARAQLDATASPMPAHMARAEQVQEGKAPAASQAALALEAASAAPADNAEAAHDGGAEAQQLGLRLKRARAAREEALADNAALERDHRARSLLLRTDVEFVLADFGRTLQALLERLADRYTPDLVACCSEPAAIHAALMDAGRDLGTELAHHMKRRSQDLLTAERPA